MKSSRLYVCLAPVLALVLAVLSGCGETGEKPAGDWIVTRLSAEPGTLNPLLDTAASYAIRILSENVYESLLKRNNETLELEPHLAESYEISEDHLTYTFKLRKDVTFSDGVPMTAEDVKFSYDAILNPENDTVERRSYFADIESIEILDKYTIQLKCTKPYFLHLDTFAVTVLPKHIFGKGDFNTHPNNRHPIGTGPYVLESWETGLQVTLAKRPGYWNPEGPHAAKIMFKFVTDDNAALQLLKRQDIDAMRLQPDQAVNRTGDPGFEQNFSKRELYSPVDGYVSDLSYIGWNARLPQFSDKRVRRAMTMLLDRETLLEKVWHGLGRVITGYAFPDSPEYDKDIEPWPYDPEAARKLLDEAGWIDTDGDGIRDKDGVAFKFSLMFPPGRVTSETLATVFQEQLKKAGIEMTIRPIEWAAFMETIHEREFEAIMLAWVVPVENDPYQLWHSSQAESGSNYVPFINAEADKLMEDARLEFDREKRIPMYRRFHAILHDESPYTFLFNRIRTEAVASRFQHVQIYPAGFDYHEWWVPADKQRY